MCNLSFAPHSITMLLNLTFICPMVSQLSVACREPCKRAVSNSCYQCPSATIRSRFRLLVVRSSMGMTKVPYYFWSHIWTYLHWSEVIQVEWIMSIELSIELEDSLGIFCVQMHLERKHIHLLYCWSIEINQISRGDVFKMWRSANLFVVKSTEQAFQFLQLRLVELDAIAASARVFLCFKVIQRQSKFPQHRVPQIL